MRGSVPTLTSFILLLASCATLKMYEPTYSGKRLICAVLFNPSGKKSSEKAAGSSCHILLTWMKNMSSFTAQWNC